MLNLKERIALLVRLGAYMAANETSWQEAKLKAERENGWFTQPFIGLAADAIINQFLQPKALEKWSMAYQLPSTNTAAKKIGVVMAGNIPLVGFHDFLCVFLSGHLLYIKASTKDAVLLKHLINEMIYWEPRVKELIYFGEMLKGCDAYIATGSNNTARYFDYYFGKYPHIIRRNRTSVALLTGNETIADLENLANDVHLYFGLGCRNVTQVLVPQDYDFVPMLDAFKDYLYFADHNKFKNNYDYQLALLILNKKYYMTNGAILLAENESIFSPIAQLHYSYYNNADVAANTLLQNKDLQCLVGQNHTPFGGAQTPTLTDYADGVDTLAFLKSL
jgi:Acyl-CoA reductase (LuxC)